MARYILLILMMLPVVCHGQFTDDFSDDDFTNAPAWLGNDTNFDASNGELRLLVDPPAAGTSFLSTASAAINNASWEFKVRLQFKPSDNNYCNVFLASNNENPNNATNAYFVAIGRKSKNICLLKKQNADIDTLIKSDTLLNSNSSNIRIKVTHDDEGTWELMFDTTNNGSFVTAGSSDDNCTMSSSHFAVQCVYTKTNSQKMFFDDFVVTGDAHIDNVAPEIVTCKAIDNNSISITFSESVDGVTALNTDNYSVDNGIGHPEEAAFADGSTSEVLLHFTTNFTTNIGYLLHYQGIKDVSGNEIEANDIGFRYVEIRANMLIISEIMADPTPTVGLPECEYVELYNNTAVPIDLTDWTFQIGSSATTLTTMQIAANGYLILCKSNCVDSLASFGPTMGLTSFPTIPNNGQTITLLNNTGMEVNKVSYSTAWYHDNEKDDGGWSLEIIDPRNTCSPRTNWTASVDASGGTPGRQNSVYAENIDTIAPQVTNVAVTSTNELSVFFSEPVDSTTACVSSNYVVTPDCGDIFHILLDDNEMTAILQYSVPFDMRTDYSIAIGGVTDLCANVMRDTTFEFSNYAPAANELIFSEIMADPDPPAGLPNCEYVEIFNRTQKKISLSKFSLAAGSSKRTLPNVSIAANGYLVLCNENCVANFDANIDVAGVAGFPSLTNSGGTLVLYDKHNAVVNTVTYSDSWYGDNFKKEGGWSLEIIDPNNPCEGVGNWTASTDKRGGTPGTENSVLDNNPDISRPYPIAAEAIAPDTLILYFNEILQKDFAENKNNFCVPEFGHPKSIKAAEPDFAVITMTFDGSFERGKLYFVNIADSIVDCCGNAVEANTSYRFALPDSVAQNDIAINELLFNPLSGGSDFVELYNKSAKILDLKQLWLSNKDDKGDVNQSYCISKISRLLLPQEYCAISTDIGYLIDNYEVPYPENLFRAANLPSMPDDKGNLTLTDRYFNLVEEVNYDKSQHYKLLATQDGVSLERINFAVSASETSNWHSAAQTAGFATPGYVNSQYADNIGDETTAISLSPEVFSPDNDGYNDRLNINYNLDKAGYTATIAIYNASGGFVTYILNNMLLDMSGTLFWDGFDNGNNLCNIGVYIVYVEMFHPDGDKIAEKHSVVISKKRY